MADWVTIVAIIIVVVIVAVTALGFSGKIRTEQLTGKCQFSSGVCNVGKMLGIPDFFLTNRNFMFYFLMPLGAIGAIVYGFLDRIHLFRNQAVNVSIAIFIALASIPTQVLTMLAATMLTLLGTYAVGAFVVVFVFGVLIVSVGTIRSARNVFTPTIAALNSEIDYLQGELDKLKPTVINLEERQRLMHKIAQLKAEAAGIKIVEKAEKKGEHN